MEEKRIPPYMDYDVRTKETMEEKLMPIIDFTGYCKDKYLLDMGDYEIKEENGKTYAVRKQPPYPKTYGECCEVLRLCTVDNDDPKGYKWKLIIRFEELLIARDAYWKIAGDWEPDWEDTEIKFCIRNLSNKIDFYDTYKWHYVLAFPTEEMRDAFFENFKDLIEYCKGLL